MNTHQVLIIVVVDTRIFGCVADSLQDRRFAGISPTDYKNTEVSIFRSEVVGITVVHGYGGKGEETTWERRSRILSRVSLMYQGHWSVVETNFGHSLDLTIQGKQW